ncbi:MAG: hypothetical protein MJ065_04575 [Oscillospiraceae bacterium]|nr:hypothetical protein [Oscillospiraceae bacterium]
MTMELMTMLSALPLGDDTPIWLYALIGILALGLIVGSVFMSKKAGDQKNQGGKQDQDNNK